MRNVLVLTLSVLAFYYFSQSQFFALKSFEITGLKQLSRDEVIQKCGLTSGMNYFRLDLRQAEKRLRAMPIIEKVEVSKRLPSTVVIIVKEREPCALLCTDSGFLVIDNKGYCLEKVAGAECYSFPVITGLVPDTQTPGELISKKRHLQLVLAALSRDIENYISEINIASDENLIAYSRQGIPIMLGTPEELPEKLKMGVAFLGSLETENAVEYVDIRAVQALAVKYSDPEAQKREKLFAVF